MSDITKATRNAVHLGVDLASKAVIASAVAALPLLKAPGINFVFTWGVKWVTDKLTPFLENFFIDTVIDFQVEAERNAYNRAREEFHAVLEKAVKSEKEIQNASEEFDRKLADLIRFRP